MNIYVSNLSFRATEEDLKNMFSKFGTVTSVKIILDKETNRSRGFAFVDMPSDAEANEAIENLNGKDVGGRAISVSVAREREKKSGNNTFFRGGGKRW